MISKSKDSGFILLMVNTLSMVVAIGIVSLLFILRANIRNIEEFRERGIAYYLCETGASVAILDIGAGRAGGGPGQNPEREFIFKSGGKDYKISYKVSRYGDWRIESKLDKAYSGFTRNYYLIVEGERAFPYFILRFPSK